MKKQGKQVLDSKRRREKKIVDDMIRIYCRGHRHGKEIPCSQCRRLMEYAEERVNRCPFMETKSFCSSCEVHCYQPEMREQIHQVMRYAGPRILFRHPVQAISHLVEEKKVNSRLRK